MNEFFGVMDVVMNILLVVAVLIVIHTMYKSIRKRYLKAKLIRVTIATYTSIPFFNRGEIKHMRGILESSRDIIPDYVYSSATKLLDIREEVLNAREEKNDRT